MEIKFGWSSRDVKHGLVKSVLACTDYLIYISLTLQLYMMHLKPPL